MIVNGKNMEFNKSNKNELSGVFPINDYYFYWKTDYLHPAEAADTYNYIKNNFLHLTNDVYVEFVENKHINLGRVVIGFVCDIDEANFLMLALK